MSMVSVSKLSPRFSLLTLFMLIAAAAIAAVFVRAEVLRRQEFFAQQKGQWNTLEQLGDVVSFGMDHWYTGSEQIFITTERNSHLFPVDPSDRVFTSQVTMVSLEEYATSEDFRSVARLPFLDSISLASRRLTDEMCEELSRSGTLKCIIAYGDCGEHGFKALCNTPNLEYLMVGIENSNESACEHYARKRGIELNAN